MNTKALEKFAQNARRLLHEQVSANLERVRTTDSAELRAKAKMVDALEKEIRQSSREAVVEKVAYTWFNRFIALRYMDANHYTRVGAVSPAPGHTQPEILQEAKQGHVDGRLQQYVDEQTVFGLLSGRLPSSDPQQEAYRLLLVGVCNYYHTIMPFMFGEIDDYTELLMPEDLLSEGSILQATREALTPENCADIEVIGWLYQYYISEKKDEVIGSKKNIEPEDIPAATQLFTPHWIVRYLVENSLGRLWLLNHPDSRLGERMDYYIEPEQQETDFLRVESPEALTVCDPAAGSGHMLTYAFDLLYAIYEEQGYNPTDIPRLILEKNLYGMEIDERAGALAAFALMMKARDRDRRFFRREREAGGIQPNVIVLRPISFEEGELEEEPWLEGLEGDRRERLLHDLHLFQEADNFGSLLRPQLQADEIAAIRERVQGEAARDTLFAHERRQRLLQALTAAEYLARQHHVVIANPPYMGRRNMNTRLKKWAKNSYPKSKSDLFAMFIERGSDLVANHGYNAMVTMESWMFLSSYERLRKTILRQSTLIAMVHMPYLGKGGTSMGINFGTAATIFRKHHYEDYKGHFSCVRYYETNANGVPLEFPVRNERLALVSAADFKKIPGSPLAYWISDHLRAVFEEPSLKKRTISDGQNKTGNNNKFVREHWEVSQRRIGVGKKWFFYAKGGSYRRWYGNINEIIDWSPSAREHYRKDRVARIIPEYLWYERGITWSLITSSKPSFRLLPENATFDVIGSSIFFKNENDIEYCLGLLNSVLVTELLDVISSTVAFQVRDIRQVPWLQAENRDQFENNVRSAVRISREDWNSRETAWGFDGVPLLQSEFRGSSLAKIYPSIRQHWHEMTCKLRRIEEENNRNILDAYHLRDALAIHVPLEEITLTCNPHCRYGSSKFRTRNWAHFQEQFPDAAQELAAIAKEMAPEMPEEERLGLEQRLLEDTMREFISYAVGCMFGRYSLDKPGSILANQDETVDNYLRQVPDPSFMPDRDNVIPMLEGDWFTDDIAERFKKFLRVTFGQEHYGENLAFIEAALNRDIRGYFLSNFYDDHVRMYSKRPIYWLFSSPKGSFNALIYMHRYRPDTVSVVLNDYLREFRTKLTARKSHLQQVERSADASKRDKTQAVKEIDGIDKTLNELKQYEDDVLYPLATEQVDIDLDDGVLVNYNKFGKALAHVRGLSGKA